MSLTPSMPTVLIVDDDPMVLESLLDELSESYAVTPAQNGEAALVLLKDRKFDAVISDMRMPGINGVDVLNAARDRDDQLVRILLTGYSDHAAHEAASASGGVYKLAKPWGDELDITLRRALEQRERLRTSYDALEHERSARQRAELSVVQLDKLASLGTLAAGIAHEMRSPLAYIGANFDWLQDELEHVVDALESMGKVLLMDKPDRASLVAARDKLKEVQSDEVADELRCVRDECAGGLRRMTEILDGLRSYASPKSREHIEAVDVEKCVQSAIRLVRCKYKHDVEIHHHLNPSAGSVEGHPGELGQILINLLVNGIQAMGEKGKIDVWVERRPDGVSIRVQDGGPGVPEHVVPRLFEPFYTTKGEEKGNGLGLSISRGIARKHGGELSYIETAESGAAFELALPAHAPEKANAA